MDLNTGVLEKGNFFLSRGEERMSSVFNHLKAWGTEMTYFQAHITEFSILKDNIGDGVIILMMGKADIFLHN